MFMSVRMASFLDGDGFSHAEGRGQEETYPSELAMQEA